jgi:hypothetical protein
VTEAILRNLLREWIDVEYAVLELGEFEDEFDSLGQPVPHRDIHRNRYESRLAGLQRVAPDRTDLHDQHRAILSALSSIPADTRLYFWSVRGSTHEYSGIACVRGIIAFYAPHPSTDEPNA